MTRTRSLIRVALMIGTGSGRDGAIVALVSRNGQLIPPRGSTRLESGDHLFVIAQTHDRPAVDKVFAAARTAPSAPRG